MDPKMKAKLKNFNKNFNKEKKRADELGGFSEIPDGKYLSKLTSCEMKNSNAGELHLVFQFEILESAEDESLVGAKCSKWCSLEKEDGPAYLIRDLRRFGIELEDLEQLPEIAELLNNQKPELKLTLKTGNSGQFTYIDSVISEIDAGDHAGAGEDDDDDNDDNDDSDDEDVDDSSDEEGEDEGEEETEEETEDVEIEEGTTVSFTSKKGEEITGQVVLVNEKSGTVDIKSGTRSFKDIAVDRLSIPKSEEVEDIEDEEEEEEEEQEAKPAAKKAVASKKPAPAKKQASKSKKSTKSKR